MTGVTAGRFVLQHLVVLGDRPDASMTMPFESLDDAMRSADVQWGATIDPSGVRQVICDSVTGAEWVRLPNGSWMDPEVSPEQLAELDH